jgi:hypothetical protein
VGWTKRQIVDEAFGELALQGYVFDVTPEEQQTALRRLDTMMATWEARGVRVGYAFPSSPDTSDLDTDSGLPDRAVETTYLNLAIRIATGFGKTPASATRLAASEGYDALLWAAAQPQQQQLPNTLPRGAGNKPWRTANQPFFQTPNEDPLPTSRGGDLDFLPE